MSAPAHLVVADARSYGEAVAERLAATWAAYVPLFERWAGVDEATAVRRGLEALDAVAAWRPHLADELAAVAEGSGAPLGLVAALSARTELVVAAECSTVGRVRGPAGPWLAQNWDWFLDAPERGVVVSWPTFTTFTEAGMLAKVGVNDAGLALTLNILRHASDREEPIGVPVHLVLREVLGACATVDDVEGLLRSTPVSASSCLTVVTAGGDGAVFEVSPAGVARIDPAEDGFLGHTNAFLDPLLAEGERLTVDLPSSCGRLAGVERCRPATLVEARAALSDHTAEPVPVCRHGFAQVPGLPPLGTAACVLMDPVRRALEVGVGPPCSADFSRFERAFDGVPAQA